MNAYVTAGTIRKKREEIGYTQKQLADLILVSDKAVSKWENGRGLPDITLIEPLARALRVSVAELLSGEFATNRNRGGNMARGLFYVCPVCGNVLHAMGMGSFSCCGILLPALEAEPAVDEHAIRVEIVDGRRFVSMDHSMERSHYISFMAFVTQDRVVFRKLYPEQDAYATFPNDSQGILMAYCNRNGLYQVKI